MEEQIMEVAEETAVHTAGEQPVGMGILQMVEEPVGWGMVQVVEEPVVWGMVQMVEEPLVWGMVQVVEEPMVWGMVQMVEEPVVWGMVQVVEEPVESPEEKPMEWRILEELVERRVQLLVGSQVTIVCFVFSNSGNALEAKALLVLEVEVDEGFGPLGQMEGVSAGQVKVPLLLILAQMIVLKVDVGRTDEVPKVDSIAFVIHDFCGG